MLAARNQTRTQATLEHRTVKFGRLRSSFQVYNHVCLGKAHWQAVAAELLLLVS